MKVLILAGVLAVLTQCKSDICVRDQEGTSGDIPTDASFCSINCTSLECLQNESVVSNSTRIAFQGSVLNLTTTLVFENLTDITLAGQGSAISCTSLVAGLTFRFVQNLTITNLTFKNCGAIHDSTSINITASNTTTRFKSAIHLQNCTHVNITGVTVTQSNGIGLVLFDTNGTIIIENSTFENNRVKVTDKQVYPGGGGMYIEFTSFPPAPGKNGHHNTRCKYTLHNCKFVSNEATSFERSYIRDSPSYCYLGLGRGGGLFIAIRGSASANIIDISNCTFDDNTAMWGGGLFVTLQDSSQKNLVIIENCTFSRNKCTKTGGGGAVAKYQFSRDLSLLNNTLLFNNSVFMENKAMYGGGLMLFSPPAPKQHNSSQNTFWFTNCTWLHNRAVFGAAVDVPVYINEITPVFTDCKFIKNELIKGNNEITSWAKENNMGKGTFTTIKTNIEFWNSVRFEDNTGSALYVVSATTIFPSGMNAVFVGNHGFEGGAIALKSSSKLTVKENSKFSFINNTASFKGGAIYSYPDNERYDLLANDCFMEYIGFRILPTEKRNVTFYFSGNKAGSERESKIKDGDSIFISSLSPCNFVCTGNESNPSRETAFGCFFNVSSNVQLNVTTTGVNFHVTTTSPPHTIPGKEFSLPIEVKDELENNVESLFYVAVNGTVTIDPAYSYISDKMMKVYGNPGANGTIILERIGFHQLYILLDFTLDQCPPGYVLELDKTEYLGREIEILQCACGWNHDTYSYQGLLKCKSTLFQAYILNGYWAGYEGDPATPDNLMTAICPLGFCSYNATDFLSLYLLPGNASKLELEIFMCGPSRSGTLCGQCNGNRSVYFHSSRFKCGPNQHCSLGWLLYIISELLPLTIVFLTVMFANISFTSGTMNGFILFAQMLDTLITDVNGIANIPRPVYILTEVHHFIYRFFNLDFFSIDSFSFCLWKGATTLDILAFKYVTITYALVLVLFTILLMNTCNYRALCPWLRPHMVKRSVIHGLSAFLIMCYTQCVLVSLRILVPTDLKGLHYQRKVVFYSGNITFFGKDHLAYAIPALMCLITIGAVPPLLLLVYPMGWKVLAICGLSESKGVKMIPIDRLKPLLDSFQSCFKDNFRFFSGLYFVYRVPTLVAYVLAIGLTQFYVAIEVVFLVTLALHAIAQPYQKRWHNIVDTLLLVDLAIINALSLFIYTTATDGSENKAIHIASVLQVVLIYLPLLCLAGYVLSQIAHKIKRRCLKSKCKEESGPDGIDFPARLLYPAESTEQDKSLQYQEFQEVPTVDSD